MTVRRIVTPNRFIGASGDTKPTQATNPRVRDGDTFYEQDTGLLSITYDGTNWVEKVDPSLSAGTNVIGKVRLVTATGDEATEDTDNSINVTIVADDVGIGGGIQYTEADTDASITGTAVMWEDGSDTLRAVSAAKPLPVEATLLVGTASIGLLAAGTNVIGKVRLVTTAGDEITDDTLDAIKHISKANIEVIFHPFGKGNLTEDGVQFSALLTTSTDVYEVVEKATINIPGLGTPDEIEFGLTGSFQSSSTAESVLFKWEGSDNDTDWLDLHSEITYAADASALKEYTLSGRFVPTGNFAVNTTPIYVRLSIKSGGAGGETAKGKTKNSSYVKLVYRA